MASPSPVMALPAPAAPAPSSPESEALARLAANHLFLGQLEPFRAVVIALRRCDPALAAAILRAAVASGGRIDGALAPTPLLPLIAAVELGAAGEHPDPDGLVSKAEFLVLIETVIDNIADKEAGSMGVLNKLADVGVKRLRREVEGLEDVSYEGFGVSDEEWRSLWEVFTKNSSEFDSVGKFVLMRIDGEAEEFKEVLLGMLKHVQLAHLDAVTRSTEDGDLESAVSQLRFLSFGRGVDEAEYKVVLRDLVRKACPQTSHYGKAWLNSQNNMAAIYGAVLQADCVQLVRLVQLIQDEVFLEEIEKSQSSNVDWSPLPLKKYLEAWKIGKDNSPDESIPTDLAMWCCRNELYHYSRLSGGHTLEITIEASLTVLRREALEEASKIVLLFPLLQPLVAALGWDIFSGNTAMRRKLMWLFWISKSQELRLEESPRYRKDNNDISCVEYLCDLLCYHLDLALYVATVNSGQTWNLRQSLFFSRSEHALADVDDEISDPFVENLILERLAVQTPMRVLFDVVPGIKFQDAIELIGMQPLVSTNAAWKRMHDIELLHMRYALASSVLAFGEMEQCTGVDDAIHFIRALSYVKQLLNHMDVVKSPARKILMVSIIVSLFHMDDISIKATEAVILEQSLSSDSIDLAINAEGQNNMVVSFISVLLDILRCNLVVTTPIEEHLANCSLTIAGRQALEWRLSTAKHAIDELEWRLSVLQHLLPLSEHPGSWKEALVLVRAAPSKLLNLCMQRASYDIGEEAVRRFSLSAEDKAALELAEWLDGAFRKALVEDAMTRVADNREAAVQKLDVSAFCAQLGHLTTALLCIDVAVTSARSRETCRYLLEQGTKLLAEISTGSISEANLNYADHIKDVTTILVVKRVLQRLNDLSKLEVRSNLQEFFFEGVNFNSSTEASRTGQKQRALSLLHQMIDDAFQGKSQFLSGKLHNVARAMSDEDPAIASSKDSEKGGVVLGLGLKVAKLSTTATSKAEVGPSSEAGPELRGSGSRLIDPLTTKPSAYLSNFIIYVAKIGDIVDGIDTTHDFNYFSLVYEWPKDLLTRLVFERGSTDAAGRVADTMGVDFVHEVISASVPPVFPPRSGLGWACIPVLPTVSQAPFTMSSSSGSSSFTLQKPLYPLQLNLMKHLAQLSPVRAVLACVFGSTILSGDNESSPRHFEAAGIQTEETERSFYEFSLEQSERFPTLNRWIQMQSNLHRVFESAEVSNAKNETRLRKSKGNMLRKRVRESESDAESELDVLLKNNLPSTSPEPSKPDDVNLNQTAYISFGWESEGPYVKAVERLTGEGKLMDALALSDRCLRNGASDQLLQLLIEQEQDEVSSSEQAHVSHIVRNNSWQYCLRLRDKNLAAKLALKYVHCWDLDPAISVLTMCIYHLAPNDEIRSKVLDRKQSLERYRHIMSADDIYSSWQEVEAACRDDAEGLALRLAGKGAVPAALEVAESASLSLDLRRELQGRQLVKLLTTDPLSGGGPAEASRFLSSLRDSNEALPVAIGAMKLLPDLRSKQLLVHFFLKRNIGTLSDAEISRLNTWAIGLRVLALLPLPSQQRCASLHEYPQLIVEVLLMMKQLQSASLVLKEIPSLRNDGLIISYAKKAITANASSNTREPPRIPVSGSRTKQKKTSALSRPNFVQSFGHLQREARRAFSWGSRDNGGKTAQKEVQRKRKTSGLAAPERVHLDATSGVQGEQSTASQSDGQERTPFVSAPEEWTLTGDQVKDDATRVIHKYESSPDITLFKTLLSLCADELIAAKGALEICINEMKFVLSSEHLPGSASMEIMARAYHATETFVQALSYARSLLKKHSGANDISSSSERSREYRDVDDASIETGSSSTGSQYLDDTPDLLSQAELWLGRAELLQSLLGSGIVASLDDLSDNESSSRLRDRLIQEERYSMAVYTCKKCKVDPFPVWNAWGRALIRMERYAQARVKFKQALQLYKGDTFTVISEIINTVEGGPPVDVAAVRSMYEHLEKSAATIFDDSLSADAYLNVLHMPSTFPRSEKSRQSREATSDRIAFFVDDFNDGPRSNLDSIRYSECVHYLQEYARSQLLAFMFKHGHSADACALFFPPMQLSPDAIAASSSVQLVDPLSTDYGSIDDLCDLCVGYGAMSDLENTISVIIQSEAYNDVTVSQYISIALARICSYCESHRHFNYLYNFLVLKEDLVASGLCCIQLYINSSSQEEALKHLDRAKAHFEEALSSRDKANESTKVMSKLVRGKSAAEKVTNERIMRFSTRVSYQIDIVKALNSTDGPQWKTSLFGNPSDPETMRRRCFVVETLAEKHFDLSFRLLHEFDLPAVDIYAGVAASLAERKRGGQLTEFLNNIKGTIDVDEWDQVLGVAINVYANKHKERPDRLIDMLVSNHRKVLACVVCGRLKSAFQIASRSGSVADVQYVAHQALHANAHAVLDLCKQWLAQYM